MGGTRITSVLLEIDCEKEEFYTYAVQKRPTWWGIVGLGVPRQLRLGRRNRQSTPPLHIHLRVPEVKVVQLGALLVLLGPQELTSADHAHVFDDTLRLVLGGHETRLGLGSEDKTHVSAELSIIFVSAFYLALLLQKKKFALSNHAWPGAVTAQGIHAWPCAVTVHSILCARARKQTRFVQQKSFQRLENRNSLSTVPVSPPLPLLPPTPPPLPVARTQISLPYLLLSFLRV